MRNTWLDCVERAIDRGRDDIVIISADLGFGVYEDFEEKYPKNFINCGVSEQNMIGLACGLALTGKKVFCYSIANFSTLRCLEQIRNDVCYHNLDVTIVSVGGGFGYGQLGMSHHATEDLSIMRSIPNLNTYVPFDKKSTINITERLLDRSGPNYLRLERGCPIINASEVQYFKNGIAFKGDEKSNIAIFSIGGIAEEAFKLSELLSEENIISSVYVIQSFQDFDENHLQNILSKSTLNISIEENVKTGGLGSWLLEKGSKFEISLKLKSYGISGFVSKVGDQSYLRTECGIDAKAIFKNLKEGPL